MSDFQGYWRVNALGHTQTVPHTLKVYPKVKKIHATKCPKWEDDHDKLLHDCRAHRIKHHNQTYAYEAAVLDRGLDATISTLRTLHRKSPTPRQPGTEKLLFEVGRRGSGRGEFEWPRDVAVGGEDGDIFVADSGNGRIQVFNNHGIWKASFGTAKETEDDADSSRLRRLRRPMGVDIGVTGRVYVADYDDGAVKIFSASGSFGSAFRTRGRPIAVAVDAADNVVTLTCGSRDAVEIHSSQGEPLRRFRVCRDHAGGGGCDCAPQRLAVPRGKPQKLEIFVTDAANSYIRVFDYEGRLLRRVSLDDPASGLALSVSGLCYDDDDEDGGALVVVDALNHAVHRFDAFDGYGVARGTVILPTDDLGAAVSVVTTPEGHLAVTELGANSEHCFKVFRYRDCECHRVVEEGEGDAD